MGCPKRNKLLGVTDAIPDALPGNGSFAFQEKSRYLGPVICHAHSPVMVSVGRLAIEHPNPARGAGVLKGTWARPPQYPKIKLDFF